MRSTETPVEVLYVVGAVFSGSTLMDIMLGSHPETTNHGELDQLLYDGWVLDKQCSCGRRAEECPFWGEVRRRWLGRGGVEGVEAYAALQGSFERYRGLPRLLAERLRLRLGLEPSARFVSYARHTRALFEALREASGKRVVVDSSKEPPRALALSMVGGLDLRLVHLVRDGRGVAASLGKKSRRDEGFKAGPVWVRALLWVMVNLASEWVARRLGPERSARVGYEGLVADPAGALGEVGRVAGLDFAPQAEALAAGEAVAVGHVIAGNRLRKSESVRLRPEAGDWRGSLTAGQRGLFWALAGWMLRRYGYKKR